jgi:hypothetical protein
MACGFRARLFFVTKLRPAVAPASDRLRLGRVKKSGSLPRFVQNRVFRIFSLATLAFRHLCRASCLYRKNHPDARSRKASNKREKNKKQTFLKHLKPF